MPVINFLGKTYNKLFLKRKLKLEVRNWPYQDLVIDDDGDHKLVYLNNEKELESRLSRKFRGAE